MDYSIAKALQQIEEVISMVYERFGGVAQVPTQETRKAVNPWDLVRELQSLHQTLARGFPLEILKDFSREDEMKLERLLGQFEILLSVFKSRSTKNSGLLEFELVRGGLVTVKDALILEFRLDDTSWGKDRWASDPAKILDTSPLLDFCKRIDRRLELALDGIGLPKGSSKFPKVSNTAFRGKRKEGLGYEPFVDAQTGETSQAFPTANSQSLMGQALRGKIKAEGREGLVAPGPLMGVGSMAKTYLEQGRWVETGQLQAQELEKGNGLLGKEHPETLAIMASLASTYCELDRWGEAEQLQVQVLETNKRVLGEDHLCTLTSMADLALIYRKQGLWGKAEELEVKVLEASKKIWGEEHPNTLTSMASLALVYRSESRWREAELLQLHVLEARRRVLGEEHPDTLTSMSNLASTYRCQGRLVEAEELQVQILEASERILGGGHPNTWNSMANLASTFFNQGRWKEAELLQSQVLEARRRVLDEGHPDALIGMANLASTYRIQGRWKEAELLQLQVLEARRRVLDEGHPDTLIGMANLASTYRIQGLKKEAWQLQLQIVAVKQRVLGKENPDTPYSKYRDLGQSGRDKYPQTQVSRKGKGFLGKMHLEVRTSVADSASTSHDQGQQTGPEELQAQVPEISKTCKKHLGTLTIMTGLASTYRGRDQLGGAEYTQVQAPETGESGLDERHLDTQTSVVNLASTFHNRGQQAGPEEPQVQVLEMIKTALGGEHPEILTGTALPYRDQDRPGVTEQHLGPLTSAPSTSYKQDHTWARRQHILGNRGPKNYQIGPTKGCGTVLSSIVSTDIAERYQQLCSSYSPQDATPGAPAQAPTSSGSTISQVLVDALPSRPSAVLARSGRSPPQHNSPALSNLSRAQPSQPCVSSVTYILCCIRKSSIRKRQRRTVLAQVLKQPSTNDREFFQTLKLEYLRIRGWRRRISLSTVKRIKFVRFVRYYRDFVACYGAEELPLPTDQDYEYIPKPPANPPIFLAEEFLHYFEEPNCAGISTDCLDLMPKRVTGRLADGKRVEAWGIQTQEPLSGLRFALLLLVIWLGMFTFAVWWLVRHHGDLQNAFAPANYFTACAAVCIVIPQALQFYSDHRTRP